MSTPVQSPAAYTPGTEVRDTRSTSMKPCALRLIPASSQPMASVHGTMPTVSRQWLPRTVRPSSIVTVTVSRSRLTIQARERPVSTQAPPSPSESTTVTPAPSWAATRAAS